MIPLSCILKLVLPAYGASFQIETGAHRLVLRTVYSMADLVLVVKTGPPQAPCSCSAPVEVKPDRSAELLLQTQTCKIIGP